MRFRKVFIYQMMLWLCFMPMGKLYAQIIDKSFAPHKTERKHAIKVNLLSPVYSTLNLSYQHVLNHTSSIQLTATYMDFDFWGDTYNPSGSSESVKWQRTQGFSVMPEYRYVTNGRGLSGTYVAPFLRYAYYEYSQVAIMDSTYYNSQLGHTVTSSYEKPDFYAYHTVAFGCVFGKQVLFKNRVCIDFFGGPVISMLVSSNKDIQYPGNIVIGPSIPKAYIKGVGIRMGITFGLVY